MTPSPLPQTPARHVIGTQKVATVDEVCELLRRELALIDDRRARVVRALEALSALPHAAPQAPPSFPRYTRIYPAMLAFVGQFPDGVHASAVAKHVGRSIHDVGGLLIRGVKRGELVRVSRGVYATASPDKAQLENSNAAAVAAPSQEGRPE